MISTKLPLITLLALFAIHFSHLSAEKIVRPIEQTITLDGVSRVEVNVPGGFINVSGDKRSDAHLLVEKVYRNASEKEADTIDAEIMQSIEVRDDVLYIDFEYDNDWSLWSLFKSKPTVHFNVTLSVPKSIDVDLHTSGGHIDVNGLEGQVAARTSGGL